MKKKQPRSKKRAGKKICIVTPEYPPRQWGGLARTVGKVALHAQALGLDVHVACLTVDAQPTVLLDENRETRNVDGITVHDITVGKERLSDSDRGMWDCPHNLTFQMMYQSLEMLHAAERFDLMHSFFLYPVGFVAGLLTKRMKIPSVVTIVGNDVKRYIFSPEKTAVCRSGLENADRVVALSRDLMEMADALTPVARKTRIIYNSVDIPQEPRICSTPRTGAYRIGCAGIFKYAKGLPYLFKAVARLAETRNLLLELVGAVRDSEKETFERVVSGTGVRKVLRLLPPLPHDRVPEWLKSLDLFVLPSLTEGCPNILMEAMAAGVPVVATRTGAAEELVKHKVSGLLVPWGDSTSLAAAMGKIMDDDGLAESLAAAGRKRMQRFDTNRERKAWEALYRGLLDF
jgi:L-malate glycosyltransferase